MRAERREETAAALREQLRAAEAGIDVPDGLWERVSAPAPQEVAAVSRTSAPKPYPRRPSLSLLRRHRPVPFAVIAVAAAAVAAVVFGTWWMVSPSSHPAAPAHTPSATRTHGHLVTLRVHNAEVPCRKLHTLECAMRIAKNPYARYAAPGNEAGHVWHGDKVSASCVITDGRLITDEKGMSSTRWYRIRKTAGDGGSSHGAEGWLPGVRTRNSTEVPACTGSERPPRSGG